jgi:hypothetical protein
MFDEVMQRRSPTWAFERHGGWATRRRLRLFSCACCRRIWEHLPDGLRRAVEMAERYADGMAEEQEMLSLRPQPDRGQYDRQTGHLVDAVWKTLAPDDHLDQQGIVMTGATSASFASGGARGIDGPAPGEGAAQAALVWCIFAIDAVVCRGFRPDPITASLAQSAYEDSHTASGELDPDRVAVLADCVEETGGDDTLLKHLREPGIHVKGCWAVDACRDALQLERSFGI